MPGYDPYWVDAKGMFMPYLAAGSLYCLLEKKTKALDIFPNLETA